MRGTEYLEDVEPPVIFLANHRSFLDAPLINYFNKTLQNLNDNPHAALYFWSAEINACFQIKGQVEIKTAGADYERMRARVHSVRPDLSAKSLVVIHIAEIYDCLPGPSAGAKLQ